MAVETTASISLADSEQHETYRYVVRELQEECPGITEEMVESLYQNVREGCVPGHGRAARVLVSMWAHGLVPADNEAVQAAARIVLQDSALEDAEADDADNFNRWCSDIIQAG